MFRIGEFAQIAQVSGRQLRFYDQLGLLRPVHTDAQTGYRYYSIRQLPRLNRILALKDLGFTLEQIGPLLEAEISVSELRGMLTIKRAQVEQSLRDEQVRLKHIESRIAQIDSLGALVDYDVVLKSVPAAPFLSLRSSFASMDEVISMVCAIADEGSRKIGPAVRDKLIIIAGDDQETDGLDLEIGISLTRQPKATVRLAGNHVLQASVLAEVPAMATIVRTGTDATSHTSFGAIGLWIEANNYAIAGPCREVFLEPVTGPADFEKALVEIQFPVFDLGQVHRNSA